MDVGMAEAGQLCDEPLHKRRRGTPSSGRFGIDHGLWGSAPGRWDMDHDGQDATSDVGRPLGHVAILLGLFGTCDMMLEPQEGQRFTHLVVIMP